VLSLRDRSDWQIRPRAKADVLSALGDYPPLVCQLLLNPGSPILKRPRYFQAEQASLNEPTLLKGLHEPSSVWEGPARRERVAVFLGLRRGRAERLGNLTAVMRALGTPSRSTSRTAARAIRLTCPPWRRWQVVAPRSSFTVDAAHQRAEVARARELGWTSYPRPHLQTGADPRAPRVNPHQDGCEYPNATSARAGSLPCSRGCRTRPDPGGGWRMRRWIWPRSPPSQTSPIRRREPHSVRLASRSCRRMAPGPRAACVAGVGTREITARTFGFTLGRINRRAASTIPRSDTACWSPKTRRRRRASPRSSIPSTGSGSRRCWPLSRRSRPVSPRRAIPRRSRPSSHRGRSRRASWDL